MIRIEASWSELARLLAGWVFDRWLNGLESVDCFVCVFAYFRVVERCEGLWNSSLNSSSDRKGGWE